MPVPKRHSPENYLSLFVMGLVMVALVALFLFILHLTGYDRELKE